MGASVFLEREKLGEAPRHVAAGDDEDASCLDVPLSSQSLHDGDEVSFPECAELLLEVVLPRASEESCDHVPMREGCERLREASSQLDVGDVVPERVAVGEEAREPSESFPRGRVVADPVRVDVDEVAVPGHEARPRALPAACHRGHARPEGPLSEEVSWEP